jgi:hypothetical protein
LSVNVVYQAEAGFQQGPVLLDNRGDPDPSGQIAAGTIQSPTVTYLPVRRCFYGPLADGTLPDNSNFIRGLVSSTLNPQNNTVMAADVAVGAVGVCFAYPETLRPITSIIQQQPNINVTSGFSTAIVSVEGAAGHAPIDYRVYWIINAFPFTGPDRFTATI